uniref:Inhibitor of growth protein n=1 Tax=Chromera velia CCMP2878 TaxID=1169474 RepID=A0A0G4EZV9_9ALVE|eukprot:Cvel_14381.t1-p1 / transcript=Cvel_14381.t1 / gene=Cvel_14381 / organism=Chromera_velia_CCMP2878 / gene_product=hypothetical protein / transcript_product=hypothetical protein / location=Cvel_scaffold1020:51067-54063(-) / protein_length=450 / sequence_SO=supercontig / SO=protein_coding / is_pseudo=false
MPSAQEERQNELIENFLGEVEMLPNHVIRNMQQIRALDIKLTALQKDVDERLRPQFLQKLHLKTQGITQAEKDALKAKMTRKDGRDGQRGRWKTEDKGYATEMEEEDENYRELRKAEQQIMNLNHEKIGLITKLETLLGYHHESHKEVGTALDLQKQAEQENRPRPAWVDQHMGSLDTSNRIPQPYERRRRAGQGNVASQVSPRPSQTNTLGGPLRETRRNAIIVSGGKGKELMGPPAPSPPPTSVADTVGDDIPPYAGSVGGAPPANGGGFNQFEPGGDMGMHMMHDHDPNQEPCPQCGQINAPVGSESNEWVGCDECSKWYHQACVGYVEVPGQDMDEWLCPTCKEAGDSAAPFTQTLTPSVHHLLAPGVGGVMSAGAGHGASASSVSGGNSAPRASPMPSSAHPGGANDIPLQPGEGGPPGSGGATGSGSRKGGGAGTSSKKSKKKK